MNISVGIVAFNEEKNIDTILKDILKQDYPLEKIELLLIDSMSEDATSSKMFGFRNKYEDRFLTIKVLKNEKKIQGAGWNVAIDAFSTDALIRLDAHASIPKDFVRKNVETLESGEYVCGGIRPTIVSEDDKWQRVLNLAENSMFGSSISEFRGGDKKEESQKEKKYVKSVFHAAYRREVIEKTGHFSEELIRTEDNEYHYRVRKAGYKICMSPDIISYQMIRPDFKGMLKQKYSNGYWIGRTVFVAPGCLAPYHFVPFTFILGIILTSILALFGKKTAARLMWIMYILFAYANTLFSVLGCKEKDRQKETLFLPVIFLSMHIAYGSGTGIGLISGLKKKRG